MKAYIDYFSGAEEKPADLIEMIQAMLHDNYEYVLDETNPHGFYLVDTGVSKEYEAMYGDIDYESYGITDKDIENYVGSPECTEMIREFYTAVK